MPLTLAESAKLSQDMLQRGVIETIIEDSPMLRYLPWIQVEGNSFKYNQEATLGGAQFYAVNAAWRVLTPSRSRSNASHSRRTRQRRPSFIPPRSSAPVTSTPRRSSS